MAKELTRIPFDPVTSEILNSDELPYHWGRDPVTNEYVKEYDPAYLGLSIIWVNNDPFNRQLKLVEIACSYKTPYAILEDTVTKAHYTMYAVDFNRVLNRFNSSGFLEGSWKFRKPTNCNSYLLVGV